ncbi:MAG: PQQ-dependent sugar dehydrogenase [Phycisphaerales bacterium]|nr:PQQ-dependent sugar dehydrogenase [Phycisphaerales bacterium]
MDQKAIRMAWISGIVVSLVGHNATAQPLDNPLQETIQIGNIEVSLIPVATGLTAPNWGITAPGDSAHLFVSDQNGILWSIDLASCTKSVFLDASNLLVELGVAGPGSFDERGLLGFAFDPDYATNGLIYTYTSEPVNGPADFSTMPAGTEANHQTVITEWRVPNPINPSSVVDPNSAREILRIDQPQFNHNAGGMHFDSSGFLLIALGDGGAADDKDGQGAFGPIVGHGENGNGQDPSNILGTLIRIDPSGANAANGKYGIPADNPFVGTAGMLDEIFAYGFRNPFRFSFDSASGDLYVTDVGQNDIEEVNIVTSGDNCGWNLKEGTFFFDPNGDDDGFVTDQDPGGLPADLVDPIAQYDHDDGLAIIGGFVYRGTDIPEIVGRFVFGEFAKTFNNDGRLFYLDAANQILEFQITGQAGLGLSLLGFAQDANGEIYVLANTTGTPFGETGVVLKIAPANTVPANPKNDCGCGNGVDGIMAMPMMLVGMTWIRRRYRSRKSWT